MITNRLSDLIYQQSEDVQVDPFAMPMNGMMMAQAKPQPDIYWKKRMQMNDFETPDEELFRRANQQQAPAQGGGYKPGSDYVAPRPLTREELEARHKRIMEEAARNRRR